MSRPVLNILSNARYLAVSQVVMLVVSFLALPYAAKVLGPEAFGVLSFPLVFTAYSTAISTLGINTFGLKEVPQISENNLQLRRFTSTSLVLMFTANLICVALFLLTVLFFFRSTMDATYILITAGAILLYSFNLDWWYQALNRYSLIFIKNFLSKVLTLILILYFVRSEIDGKIFLLCWFGPSAVFNLLLTIYTLIKTKFSFSISYTKSFLKKLRFFFLGRFASSIYTSTDGILVSILESPVMLSYFTLSNRITRSLINVVCTINSSALPIISQNSKDSEANNKEVIENLFFLLLILSLPISLSLCYFAENIILLLLGPEFLGMKLTLQLFSVFILIATATNFVGLQILIPTGLQKIVSTAQSKASVINIVLNLILIPIFSVPGAIAATCSSELFILFAQIRGVNLSNTFSPPLKKVLRILALQAAWFVVTVISFHYTSHILAFWQFIGLSILQYLICFLLPSNSLLRKLIWR